MRRSQNAARLQLGALLALCLASQAFCLPREGGSSQPPPRGAARCPARARACAGGHTTHTTAHFCLHGRVSSALPGSIQLAAACRPADAHPDSIVPQGIGSCAPRTRVRTPMTTATRYTLTAATCSPSGTTRPRHLSSRRSAAASERPRRHAVVAAGHCGLVAVLDHGRTSSVPPPFCPPALAERPPQDQRPE